jgi:hypothetical protein
MEIPYRSSTAESEGQRSSIAVPSISPQTLAGTTNSSLPTSPVKINSVTSAVSSIFNRNRQRSTRRYVYEEMKWTLRRRSANEVPKSEEVSLNNNNNNSINEDADDYRVTVV